MLRRIVYFAFGLALIGVAVIGVRPVTGVATTAQVIIKQDFLNPTRPEMPTSELDRLADRQWLNRHFVKASAR
jgi:hypothetical protein